VAAALASAGFTVRAASRHPGSPAANVTPTRFDWYDESTWAASVAGADALFVKGLDSDDHAADVIARLLAAAPRARHVVLKSAVGVGRAPATAPRRAVEEAVRESGRNWTILRPNWLMQNFDEDEWVYARAIREDDELVAGSGGERVGFVDARDVADAAAAVLTGDGHHGREYDLTGPEALTFGAVADILTRAAGRPVRHVEADLDRHRAHFARSGRPDAWIDHMMHLFVQVRAGECAAVTDDVHRLTGHAPRSLAAYAEEAFAPRSVPA
jgi:uncharacterized protein YbjT (DUF2867 family)